MQRLVIFAVMGAFCGSVIAGPLASDVNAYTDPNGIVWRGLHAQGIEPTKSTGTRVIDFNDLDSLEEALTYGVMKTPFIMCISL